MCFAQAADKCRVDGLNRKQAIDKAAYESSVPEDQLSLLVGQQTSRASSQRWRTSNGSRCLKQRRCTHTQRNRCTLQHTHVKSFNDLNIFTRNWAGLA